MTRKIVKVNGILSILFVLVLLGCSSKKNDENQTASTTEETKTLLNYLENNGNLINDPDIPYFITAPEVYNNLRASNYHVIDVRKPREFKRGHIENAINIQPDELLHYFENKIEPNSFEKITFVDENGQLSGYVTIIMRFLGYDNVYTLKYGMSSWNEETARRYWWANISNDLVGLLETRPNPKNEAGPIPAINTGETTGYEILRERAEEALRVDWEKDIAIQYMDIWENPDKYYVVNYWPEPLYNMGHLPGAVQYNPKKSLHSTEDLYTLPTDKPIVPYCFTGHNASYVNGFLKILGYEVKNLDYAANGFIHQTIMQTQTKASRWFQQAHVNDFPLSRKDLSPNAPANEAPAEVQVVETISAQGGC